MRHKKKKDQFGDGFCQFGTRESWERNTGETEAGQKMVQARGRRRGDGGRG